MFPLCPAKVVSSRMQGFAGEPQTALSFSLQCQDTADGEDLRSWLMLEFVSEKSEKIL